MHPKVEINLKTGLLQSAEFLPSPNFDLRPAGMEIDLLVIHNISLPPGKFEGNAVERFFQNQLDFSLHPFYTTLINLKVSAHLFIRRQGTVIQFVPFHLRAWHAGESFFQGQEKCNDFSIGIELEGTDHLPYTSMQYRQLSLITVELMKIFPGISLERIVGHQTIAPTRKTDPGQAFDWNYYFDLLGKRKL